MLGVISSVDPSGVGLIFDGERRYPFTFDDVHGYSGQPPGEFGLVRGASVVFKISGRSVAEVFLLPPGADEVDSLMWDRFLAFVGLRRKAH